MEHHTVQSLYTLNLLALPKPIISRPKRRYSVTSAGLQGIRAAKYLDPAHTAPTNPMWAQPKERVACIKPFKISFTADPCSVDVLWVVNASSEHCKIGSRIICKKMELPVDVLQLSNLNNRLTTMVPLWAEEGLLFFQILGISFPPHQRQMVFQTEQVPDAIQRSPPLRFHLHTVSIRQKEVKLASKFARG